MNRFRFGGPLAILLGVGLLALALVPRSAAAPPTPAVARSPATGVADLDARIAFWQARVTANRHDLSSAIALADAYLARVRANGDLADLDRAGAALDLARQSASPQDVRLALREGQLAFTLHQFVEAADAARHVLQLDPGNGGALALLGDASFELGNVEDGHAAYEQLAARGRSAPILSRLAREDLLHGDARGAEALLGFGHLDRWPPGAHAIDGPIVDDGEQLRPGTPAPRIEEGAATPGGHECIVHDILGHGPLAEHPDGGGHRDGGVSVIQHTERLTIASLDPPHHHDVVGRRLVHVPALALHQPVSCLKNERTSRAHQSVAPNSAAPPDAE